MVTQGTNPDPLADLIAEYRRQVAIFTERAKHEEWETLTAATYGPPLEGLWHHTPEPNSPAGVLAAMLLAKDEPDLYALASINEACIRFLQREAALGQETAASAPGAADNSPQLLVDKAVDDARAPTALLGHPRTLAKSPSALLKLQIGS